MRNSRNVILLLAALLLVCSAAFAQDPGARDTVRVAKVSTNAGLKVGVPVTCFNDENIAAYSLGFIWNSADVTADSVNYAGTRLPAATMKLLTIDNTAKTILVGMTDFTALNPLTPGNGLLFTMWFSISSSAADQFVDLDSTFVPPAGRFVLVMPNSNKITPEFFKGQIKIGNPQPPPVIVLSQYAFTFNAEVGGGNPTSQVQQITNGGGQSLNWTAVKQSTWLGLSPSSGTAPSVVVVTCNIIGLTAGTYVDTVQVTAPGATNSPDTFTVTLNLTIPPPTIELSPDSFYFQALQNGPNPPGKVLNITNVGQGTLNWTATKNAAWLTLSSYSGTAPSAVTLTVDNTGLPPGIFTDSIRVSDPNATNDPQYAKVRFEVFSAFPVIDPSPDSIFAAGSGTENPYPRTLLIQNNGGGVMNWQVTKTKPWLSFDIDTGSAVQGSPGAVTVTIDGSTLYFGTHRDTITITSSNATNSPIKVPVAFWKMEVPQRLNVNTNALSFTEVECGSYPGVGPKTFIVSPSISDPPLEWKGTHSAPWLTFTPSSALNGATVTVRVYVAGLSPGVYKDTIVISSDVAINPPESVVVTFTVTPTTMIRYIGLSEDSLFYLYKYTQVGSAEQEVVIYNTAGGCIDWQATASVPWLTPIPSSGITLQSVTIRADAINLSLGRHTGEIIFTSSTAANSPKHFPVIAWVYTFGDANGDGIVDISDVVYDIEYIFQGGPAPIPVFWTGDANCDRTTDISDCVWLLDWIFNLGPPPCLY